MSKLVAICEPGKGEGKLLFETKSYPCIFGKAGLTLDKKEGDMKTPIGKFPLRRCFYREDKMGDIQTVLEKRIIQENDGWCDDVRSEYYNRLVSLPFKGRHEKLWRDDEAYDLFIEIGYNDDPVISAKGSAIFLHVMHEDKRPTAGCLSLSKEDFIELISFLPAEINLEIKER